MSGVVSRRFAQMVPHGKLEPCIAFLEDGLRAIKRTPYHRLVGRDFLGQTGDLADWLIDFCRKAAAARRKLTAVYLEMNGFAINPKQWHCDVFGYKKAGELWDLDWLSEWDAEADGCFVLSGMGPVQEAFAALYLDDTQPLGVKLAEEVAEHLVTARFMQLVAAAHKAAKRKFPGLRGLPVLATAHDWDTAHRTT